MHITWWVLALLVLLAATPAHGNTFDQWVDDLRRQAIADGISPALLDQVLDDLEPLERIIELDRNQPEFKLTFRDYLDRVAPDERVRKGRELLTQHRDLLREVSDQYGVPPQMIVALWGVESDFGRLQGGFGVIQALVTLAHDGRRSAYFRGELLHALHILNDGHVSPDSFQGSWAGAMGQCQFMPSSFCLHAVDHDQDGRRDIWSSQADVFASAANYLAASGYNPAYRWGRAVRLPEAFDDSLAGLKTKHPLQYWQELGVRSANGQDLPAAGGLMASLVMPDGGEGAAFLAYPNFEVLMTWNRSVFFAAAVGVLADRIGGF